MTLDFLWNETGPARHVDGAGMPRFRCFSLAVAGETDLRRACLDADVVEPALPPVSAKARRL
jgi:hypothetical protein